MENKIDYSKKVSELTAGELADLITDAVFQALLKKSSFDNDVKLKIMQGHQI